MRGEERRLRCSRKKFTSELQLLLHCRGHWVPTPPKAAVLEFFKPSPKLVTLFLAEGDNRRLLERNSWKEQGGWEKKAAHDVRVREDAKGHLRGGKMEIQQWLEYLKINRIN